MNKILLIDENYIKENSNVYDNVDPKLLRMHIFEAQNINLKYILNDDLYDLIFDAFDEYRDYYIENSGGTSGSTASGATDYIESRIINLVNEIKPMLLYYTLYNSVYSLYGKITNKGINTQTSDYSSTIDWSALEHMKNDYKQKAESYTNLLIEYLDDNYATYPEYIASCDTKQIFSNPLYLGGEI